MTNKNLPLVTIFTLSFNSPDLFGAIDSVLMQDYGNIEYIILDDQSDNFDCNAVKEYISSKQKGNITNLIVEVNPKRLGIVAQTNKALSLSKGKFIFNLAGDDQFYDEKVISDWVKEFEKTGADVITAYREVYDPTLTKPLFTLPKPIEVHALKNYSPDELLEFMEGYNIVFGSCTARSRKAVEEVGLVEETYKLVEDYVLTLRYLRQNKKIHFFDRKVIKYRQGGVCAVDNVNKQYLEESDVIFNNEVLPYSKNKKNAIKKYKLWRQGVEFRQKANKAKSKTLFSLCYALAHPLFSVRKVNKKLREKRYS